MKRADLSESERRYFATQRGRVCRAVGQGIDAVLDAHEDPSELMEEVMELVVRRVREAEANDERLRAA